MDGTRFDSIARSLAEPGSRRRVIGGLFGAALGVAGLRTADAAVCRGQGSVCREHAGCCSGLCGPKDRTGRRTCRCRASGDCPRPPVCHAAICTDGSCAVAVADGAACNPAGGGPGVCRGATCAPCLEGGTECFDPGTCEATCCSGEGIPTYVKVCEREDPRNPKPNCYVGITDPWTCVPRA